MIVVVHVVTVRFKITYLFIGILQRNENSIFNFAKLKTKRLLYLSCHWIVYIYKTAFSIQIEFSDLFQHPVLICIPFICEINFIGRSLKVGPFLTSNSSRHSESHMSSNMSEHSKKLIIRFGVRSKNFRVFNWIWCYIDHVWYIHKLSYGLLSTILTGFLHSSFKIKVWILLAL